jgi:hypothetical protein
VSLPAEVQGRRESCRPRGYRTIHFPTPRRRRAARRRFVFETSCSARAGDPPAAEAAPRPHHRPAGSSRACSGRCPSG